MTAGRQTEILVAFLSAADGRSVKDMDAGELFRRIAAEVPDVSPAVISAAGDVAKRAGSDLRSLWPGTSKGRRTLRGVGERRVDNRRYPKTAP